MSPSFVFHTLGHKRLLRNTYTVLFSGSTQAQVPVNPVCPYTASGAEGAQGLRFTMDRKTHIWLDKSKSTLGIIFICLDTVR